MSHLSDPDKDKQTKQINAVLLYALINQTFILAQVRLQIVILSTEVSLLPF